ncbi:MAG: 1-acyl-sn-glycerol-3-phosphate acyltransferase [Bacteroidales bacterium]|nr:1-acyl-sn-glycerol-3-phosphate acyltransferase [Bacteroidales bacterium]
MNPLFLKIYSVLAWFTMVITSIIITPFFLLVWLATFWWDKRRVAAHFMGTFWAWHYRSLIPFWHLHLEGREKIPWKRPVVIVANHRSLVDILALYKLRRPFRWTSKAENFRLPFVGMVLSLSKAIRIKRESIRSASLFMKEAGDAIKEGSSVLIFPEGTRTKTGEMRRFREGAFLLAQKMNTGIIPVVHTGTEKCFSGGKKFWILAGRADIHIRVLDEIPPETVQTLNAKALTAHVRKIMEEEIKL